MVVTKSYLAYKTDQRIATTARHAEMSSGTAGSSLAHVFFVSVGGDDEDDTVSASMTVASTVVAYACGSRRCGTCVFGRG